MFIIFLMGGAWSHADAYDYPLKDPYLATVIGTPSEFQPKLPEKIDYKMLSFKVFPERVIPRCLLLPEGVPLFADLPESAKHR